MSAPGDALAVAMPRHGRDAVISDAPAALARVRTFHTLDALRGVAALVVLLFHSAFFLDLATPAEGYLAVDLFFVMSGFIIAHRYAADLDRGMGVRRFLAVRLVRLYPLFLLGTLIGVLPALVAIAAGEANAAHWGQAASLPLALLMLPSSAALPHITFIFPLSSVAWSLALELVVNLGYAATYRMWTTRRLVLLLAVGFVWLCLAGWHYGSLNVGWDWTNAAGGPPRIIVGFTLGLLIQRRHAVRPFVARLPWWLPVLLVPALLSLDPTRLGLAWLRPAWDVAIAALVIPAMVVVAIADEPPRRAQGACALAGVFSYVLYSLHLPFVGLFLRGEQRLHVDAATTSPLKALVFTALLAALCVAAHLAYDKPVRCWCTRRRAERRAGMARTPTAAVRGW